MIFWLWSYFKLHFNAFRFIDLLQVEIWIVVLETIKYLATDSVLSVESFLPWTQSEEMPANLVIQCAHSTFV